MGEPVRGTGAVAQHQKGDVEVGLRFFQSMILTSCTEEPQPMSVSIPVPSRVKPGLRLRGLESNVETTWGRLSPPRSPAKPPGLENDNLRIVAAPNTTGAGGPSVSPDRTGYQVG